MEIVVFTFMSLLPAAATATARVKKNVCEIDIRISFHWWTTPSYHGLKECPWWQDPPTQCNI